MNALTRQAEKKYSDSKISTEESRQREQLRQAALAHLSDLRRFQKTPLRSFILKDERE